VEEVVPVKQASVKRDKVWIHCQTIVAHC